jgi:hypothetical protein
MPAPSSSTIATGLYKKVKYPRRHGYPSFRNYSQLQKQHIPLSQRLGWILLPSRAAVILNSQNRSIYIRYTSAQLF